MTLRIPSICYACKNFTDAQFIEDTRRKLSCVAFPEGIPAEIINGDLDHTKPYPKDNGVRYETGFRMEDVEADYYRWRNSDIAINWYGDGPDYSELFAYDDSRTSNDQHLLNGTGAKPQGSN